MSWFTRYNFLHSLIYITTVNSIVLEAYAIFLIIHTCKMNQDMVHYHRGKDDVNEVEGLETRQTFLSKNEF